ncbi:hypothetical protein LSTR_LSTR011379 [Laodelphax striatellus]|uniref:Serpin domain-containing protein n=1 Tax=Laodelphax striatellus TaxID=195883 RepID=A0A482XRI2_LAOST|nr:hypothetical protein LSTR_LSTR011379 [Laodelphax striatellus]
MSCVRVCEMKAGFRHNETRFILSNLHRESEISAFKQEKKLLSTIIFLAGLLEASKDNTDDGVRLVSYFTNNMVPKMLQALTPGRENLVLAPFSAACSLALMMEAVPGQAAQEAASALSTNIADLPKLRSGFATLLAEFQVPPFESDRSKVVSKTPIGSATIAYPLHPKHLIS